MMFYGALAFALYVLFALLRFVVEHFWLDKRQPAVAEPQPAPEEPSVSRELTLRELMELHEQDAADEDLDLSIIAER